MVQIKKRLFISPVLFGLCLSAIPYDVHAASINEYEVYSSVDSPRILSDEVVVKPLPDDNNVQIKREVMNAPDVGISILPADILDPGAVGDGEQVIRNSSSVPDTGITVPLYALDPSVHTPQEKTTTAEPSLVFMDQYFSEEDEPSVQTVISKATQKPSEHQKEQKPQKHMTRAEKALWYNGEEQYAQASVDDASKVTALQKTDFPPDAPQPVITSQSGHYASLADTAAQNTTVEEETPVDFSADSLQHNSTTQTVIASGNVELVQDGRVLRADEMIYNLETDTVVAKGNVVLNEPSGDLFFADSFTLKRKLKEGFISGLEGYLAMGGKFTAEEGQRLADQTIVMKNASYTPCDCDDDAEGTPAWAIKAGEVRYDQEEHRISYKDARFETFGVPVFYTPRLSHPDNSVKRKSGFLTPSFGYDSDIGANITQNYYWDIAPDKDATFGVLASSDESPVALGEYRQRFDQAELNVETSLTWSDRTDDINGVERRTDEELRGHIFAYADWDINEKWRSGASLEYASDDQYLRQYDFDGEDVLESELYVERFSGRNYATARLVGFQDLRIREKQVDQPNILPESFASFYGDPNGVLGGRWSVNVSALGLVRGDGQDVNRFITEADWQRRFVSDFGLVNTFDISARGDAYNVSDREIATFGSGRSEESTETRLFTQAQLTTQYPMAKRYKKMNWLIEPVASLTVSPDANEEDDDIPNEDSQDVQLDAINLFSDSRFPGYDVIEDDSRVTYGMRTGVYGDDGSFVRSFIGQSYRFDDNDNPFPQGSGLSRQESDIVGQIAADYKNIYGIDYRFQIQSDTFNSARHEADAYWDIGRFNFDARYLYAQALAGTDINDSREQIRFASGFDVTRHWHLYSDILYNLGENEGLREAIFGVDYAGCCVSFSLGAKRNITSDASGESGTEVMFRIGLKGIGEFGVDEADRWDADNRF